MFDSLCIRRECALYICTLSLFQSSVYMYTCLLLLPSLSLLPILGATRTPVAYTYFRFSPSIPLDECKGREAVLSSSFKGVRSTPKPFFLHSSRHYHVSVCTSVKLKSAKLLLRNFSIFTVYYFSSSWSRKLYDQADPLSPLMPKSEREGMFLLRLRHTSLPGLLAVRRS